MPGIVANLLPTTHDIQPRFKLGQEIAEGEILILLHLNQIAEPKNIFRDVDIVPMGDIQHRIQSKRTLQMAVQFDLGKAPKAIKSRGATLLQVALLETWSGIQSTFTLIAGWTGPPSKTQWRRRFFFPTAAAAVGAEAGVSATSVGVISMRRG